MQVLTTNQVETLNNTLNNFEPSLLLIFQLPKIQEQTDTIGNSLIEATKDVANSDVLDAEDSFTVAEAVLDFEPKIFSLLDNIQRRKPVFQDLVLPSLGLELISGENSVYKSLQRQKQLSAAFGATVVQKLSEPFTDLAPAINKEISDAFDEAIATFSP
ncbi:uncharacterized protein RCC_04524 [Ramularia collo-cygni]|uniref:Uncharacterized protein n=1 Tax=Ramularia collo-cygni TaxID=112498 RepID=A0A2D3UZM4_9PEZI|nr:uncharacterized protein RCC_04524 [Ramularia collo-cygni]CZT18680.1 uncharacterized protein RCC_04524 [Ramularia collo-cygni]